MPLQAHDRRFELLQVGRIQLIAHPRKGIADPLQIQAGCCHKVHYPVALHVLTRMGETLGLHAIHIGSGQAIGGDDLHGGAPPAPALGSGD